MNRILMKRLRALQETFGFVAERKTLYDMAVINVRPQPLGSEPRLLDPEVLDTWAVLAEKQRHLAESMLAIHRRLALAE
jgi:hypothetical protein